MASFSVPSYVVVVGYIGCNESNSLYEITVLWQNANSQVQSLYMGAEGEVYGGTCRQTLTEACCSQTHGCHKTVTSCNKLLSFHSMKPSIRYTHTHMGVLYASFRHFSLILDDSSEELHSSNVHKQMQLLSVKSFVSQCSRDRYCNGTWQTENIPHVMEHVDDDQNFNMILPHIFFFNIKQSEAQYR